MHYSREVSAFVRALGEAGMEVRRAIELLKSNPHPEWARKRPEPGFYEFPVAGRWIIYEVDISDMETVIRVTIVE